MIVAQSQKEKFLKVMSYAFSFSILIQGLSFGRQVLIATSLGLSRNLDIYYTALAASTVIGLALNPLYDNVMTSFVRENSESEVRRFSLNVMLSCLFVAFICCLTLAVGQPLILKIYGAGFNDDERNKLMGILLYFFPWIILSAVFAVIQSVLKTMSRYKWALMTEFFSMLISLIYIFTQRKTLKISDIPTSNTLGIFLAILLTLPVAVPFLDFTSVSAKEIGPIVIRIFKQYISNQLSILTSLLERFIFSFLPPGGISAIGLITQITISASSLLSFREIYIYPLIRAKDRSLMYRRLIEGLFSLSAVCFGFLVFNSSAILSVMFEYGHFKSDDVALTSNILSVSSAFLIISILSTPAYRMLIVENKNRLIIGYHFTTFCLYTIAYAILYESSAITPINIVAAIGLVSWGTSYYLIRQLKAINISFKFKDYAKYFILFLTCTLGASYLSSLIGASYDGVLAILIRGTIYAICVGVLLFLNKNKIANILKRA